MSVQLKIERPTSVQKGLFYGVFQATRPRKGNRVIGSYGAGDPPVRQFPGSATMLITPKPSGK